MHTVEFELSDKVFRKMKALLVLRGGDSFESLLSDMLERAADTGILEHIESSAAAGRLQNLTPSLPPPQAIRRSRQAPQYQEDLMDPTGIADGLGDDDPDTPEPVSMNDTIPHRGGLTEADLDRDMEVEDPEHEAKGEATPDSDNVSAEGAFESIMGFAPPITVDQARSIHRPKKRRPAVKTKGRVSSFDGTDREEV